MELQPTTAAAVLVVLRHRVFENILDLFRVLVKDCTCDKKNNMSRNYTVRTSTYMYVKKATLNNLYCEGALSFINVTQKIINRYKKLRMNLEQFTLNSRGILQLML